MSQSLTSWDPSAHPVHRLIQLHDAAVIAFLSLKRRAGLLGQPFKHAEREEGGEFHDFMQLVRNFREVMARIMAVAPGVTNSGAVKALKVGALAWFASKQRQEAFPVVESAAASLGECWREPTGEELELGPSLQYRTVTAFTPSRSWVDEVEGRNRLSDWEPIRNHLFDELAKVGEVVPIEALEGLIAPTFGASLTDGDPLAGLPSQQELLGFVNAATVATEVDPPPAGPAAGGTPEGKVNEPADVDDPGTPEIRLPTPPPPGANPFLVLDWCLKAAYYLAHAVTRARHARVGELGRKMRSERRNGQQFLCSVDDVPMRVDAEHELARSVLERWWGALTDARQLCAHFHIPFDQYDPLLKEAERTLDAGDAVIRGVADREIHLFNDVNRRLLELANSTTPAAPPPSILLPPAPLPTLPATPLPRWAIPFRSLREQFLAASVSGRYPHCHIRLAVPALGNILHNLDRPTQAEWVRLCHQVCDCGTDLGPKEHDLSDERLFLTSGPLFGLAKSIKEFERLATMAGNALPFLSKPCPALYPLSELDVSNHSHPIHAWCEFLAVCDSTQFRFVIEGGEHWDALPTGFDPRPRHCYFSPRADPFLISATVIEAQFLNCDLEANGRRYEAEYRRVAALSVGIHLPEVAGPAAGGTASGNTTAGDHDTVPASVAPPPTPPVEPVRADGPFWESKTRFGVRWKGRDCGFDKTEERHFKVIKAMWPPEQGKSRPAAEVKAEMKSLAQKKFATNMASLANSALYRIGGFPFRLKGENGDAASFTWDQLSAGTS